MATPRSKPEHANGAAAAGNGRTRNPAPPVPAGGILDRTPPNDNVAEAAVLGCVLLRPDCLDEVQLTLAGPGDFHDDAHRTIYAAMLALWSASGKIDPHLLAKRLESSGDFDRVGGAATLARIALAVPNAAHAQWYARSIRDAAIRRALIDAGTTAVRDAYDATLETGAVLEAAQTSMHAIAEGSLVAVPSSASELMSSALDQLEARMSGRAVHGLPTGFADLDEMTGGLAPGQSVIVAGRPGMGKSAIIAQIAEHAAVERGVPTLLVTLEMSQAEFADRLLANRTETPLHRMRAGTLSADDRSRVVEYAGRLSLAPLHILDDAELTMAKIAAHARRLDRKTKGQLGLILIDYLQLVVADNERDPREQQVTKISRAAKRLAKNLGIPVVCAAQLNRRSEEGGDRRPKLSNLRESGSLEQDADLVVFVHREEYYKPQDESLRGKAILIVAKQRNGPVGDVELVWKPKFTRFDDKAPARFEAFDEFNSKSQDF